ncbi:MAG: bifunctional DNA primase/polymerase, partial [Firmicutes bacterium]|nr:bifunctional DNA primase/polymerase [Bacillota bacterium]
MLKVIELNDTGNKGVTELRAKFLWQNGAYKISHVPLNAKFPPVVKSFTDKEVWSSQPDTKTLVKEVGGLSKRNWSLFLNVSDLVCIDVDIEGMEWYNSLSPLQSDELKATLSAMTPSGGFHFIFKSKENVTYSQFTKGVDIKHKGYILIEPSVLPNGKYQWTNETEPKDMPEWLEKLCCKSKVEKLREPIPETILDEVQKSLIDDVDWDKLVEEVKPHTFDYNEFFKIGMSLHYIFSGSPFGLDLWKRLSHNASYVDGDEGRCEDKWRGYNNEKDLKVGLKTFLNIMSRKGLVPCHKETKEPVFEKYVFETDKEVVDKINEMGYYYVDQQKVICQYDGEYVKGMNVPQFNLSVAPIQKLQKSPNGKLSLVAGSSIWVKSPKRNSVGNITFTPNPRPIDLNTWPTEPFLPPPKTTVNIEFFKQFVFEVICKNDKQKYEWIMRRDAFMYQHLGRKDQTVLFLFGDEGIGKGTYTDSIHGRILGKYFTRTRKERIDDRFNEDQSRKFYTVFDEAGFLKSDKLVDIVKERTGSNTMTVESKFGAVYSIENYSRYTVT